MVRLRVPELLLLDREGVLLTPVQPYVTVPEHIRYLDYNIRTAVGMALLGAKLAVVTNQSQIGRGLASREFVDGINEDLRNVFSSYGVEVRFYVCPHRPDDNCSCRKPLPKMLLEAAKDIGVSIETSVMVGDQDSDMEAGYRAGCLQRVLLSQEVGHQVSRYATSTCTTLGDFLSIMNTGLIASQDDSFR